MNEKIKTFSIILIIAMLFLLYMEKGKSTVTSKDLKRPVIVEVFSSQGCFSCPPADNFLQNIYLKNKDKFILLSYHVNYWDDLVWNGSVWKDPFSSVENTLRQKKYVENFMLSHVYTPQVVIDGEYEVVGSRKIEFSSLVKKSISNRDLIPINVNKKGEKILISVGKQVDAELILVEYDLKHVTNVTAGENKGKTLTSLNVVNKITNLGQVSDIEISMPKSEGAIVLLQEKNQGRILGFAKLK